MFVSVIGESNSEQNCCTLLPHGLRSEWETLSDYHAKNREISLPFDSDPSHIPTPMPGFFQGPPRHRYAS